MKSGGNIAGNSLDSVPQFDRLLPTGMKLSEFVGLVTLSIAVGSKKI